MYITMLFISVLLSILCVYLLYSNSNKKIEITLLKEELYKKNIDHQASEEKLIEQKEMFTERLRSTQSTEISLREMIRALSTEALDNMQKKLEDKKSAEVKQLMEPVQEALGRLDQGMQSLEKERKKESGVLQEQLSSMVKSEEKLQTETLNLVNALRKPQVRGLWGEMQLRTVVELSGMHEYCNFQEQAVDTQGSLTRPDLIVRLPNDKQVVVDAKAPFEAFLEANALEDKDRQEEKLQQHARHVRQHVLALSKKSYWEKFSPSPEFVILFLPTEVFFSAALQHDPALIEMSAEKGVILATPTTLIGLLKAIGYGWKEDRLSRRADEICSLAHELHKRLGDMTKHFNMLGRSLTQAIDNYNRSMGSLNRRVLVSTRKLKEMGVGTQDEVTDVPVIEKVPD